MKFTCRIFAIAILIASPRFSHAAPLADAALETRINTMISTMTLTEKIGQTQLRDWGMYSEKEIPAIKQAIREGKIGGFLNVSMNKINPAAFAELQKIAVEESPQQIPLIFGQDVIHGYKTIFPIPLGQAASWNPTIVEQGARIAAEEATTDGVRWTFAPMIDIARDPRWGRIAESLGEDPYLASLLGVAMTKGFQTNNPKNPSAMAASGKHFVGYGAVEGGRDYNAAYIPEGLLRDVYLRPFKAAVDAGLMTIMSSYNTLNDVPATANTFTLKKILRAEWKFDGFVVSDWNSVMEMIPHGFAANAKDAAKLSANGGVDFEMYTDTYEKYLPELIKEGKFSESDLNAAVRNMLRIKLRLGLLENPYPRGGQAKTFLNKKNLAAAKTAAQESLVLLKNEDNVLPLKKTQTIAVIGPLAEAPFEQLGSWIYDGDKKDTQTLLPALKKIAGENRILYAQGLTYSRDKNTEGFAAAIEAAKKADVILYVGGEESVLSGEGHSRGDIRLPGAQETLIAALAQTGKPIVYVLMAGRPIQLDDTLTQSKALLMAWHPGTMGGPAIADVLYGVASPSGRLPLTWPIASGQIPVYYNHMSTGRPATYSNYTRIDKIQQGVFQHQPGNSSNHLDYGHKPQFPFGFGLTYSQFTYSNIRIDKKEIGEGESLTITADIKNTGQTMAIETVQLYTQDIAASVTRPVRELKNYQKISIQSGQSKTVTFTLNTNELAFHNKDMQLVTEPGMFNVWIAPNAAEGLQVSFEVK
jgi:beta-glucosidase